MARHTSIPLTRKVQGTAALWSLEAAITHYKHRGTDFVLYWWYKAAELVRAGKSKRFGFITTNSLRQAFGRRIVEAQLAGQPPLSLIFAIPDHPWVDTADGAAVRIAMTVGSMCGDSGELFEVADEDTQEDGSARVALVRKLGRIRADLTVGANVAGAKPLKANQSISCPGVQLMGDGFIVSRDEARALGLGVVPGLEKHIRPYLNGRDLTDRPRGVFAIDLFGLTEDEVRKRFPPVYQHVLTRVKPERETNNRASYREKWWVFGEPVRTTRQALAGLSRYITTVKTSKHRVFQFLDFAILPDSKLISFASEDALMLGVLSSRTHIVWTMATQALLEDRPTYVKSESFNKFPFPVCDAAAQERIRPIAEELDAHRKRVQAQNPRLTLTGIYNVLEKLRAGEALSEKDKQIHDAGLVSVLRQLHDDLDAAVFAAYGWSPALTDAEILERLVALNAERAKEETSGLIRWLRPNYQNPGGAQAQQTALAVDVKPGRPEKKRGGKLPWPKTLSERVKAVSAALAAVKAPVMAADVAKGFARAKAADVAEILDTLCAMGHARRGQAPGTYLP
jgi:hypothetical protein